MRFCRLLFVAIVIAAPAADAVPVAVGVFAGPGFPIQQDDTATGPRLGVRLPIAVMPHLAIEPYYAVALGGDVQERIQNWDYTRSGFDIHTFGVNVDVWQLELVPRFNFEPYAGIGAHRLSRSGSEAKTHIGYDLGLGFAYAATETFSMQVRGELAVVDAGDTSRKWVNLIGGVSFRLH